VDNVNIFFDIFRERVVKVHFDAKCLPKVLEVLEFRGTQVWLEGPVDGESK